MRVIFFPVQDASIYSEFEDKNTGLDEILEVGKTNHGVYSARSLIQFDLSGSSLPINAEFDLVLRIANAEQLKTNQRIEICQLSQSWEEGTGYFHQTILQTEDGVTWTQRNSGSFWDSGSQGGSTTGLFTTSSFSKPISDITVNVTEIVRSWISESVSNTGFLIRFPTTDEADGTVTGNVKFFSRDTHTIYQPTLVAKWDDQTYVTGSSPWPSSGLTVIPSTLKPSYFQNEVVRVNLAVRELYPLKTFATTASIYSGNNYLPSSSYFSIVDEQAGVAVIPFSNETKVHTNGNQSYVSFRVQNMYPQRFYRMLIKVIHDGLEEVFDSNAIFTIR